MLEVIIKNGAVYYEGRELKMCGALPKAVFVLFTRHPEGIRLKSISDHSDELINIYKKLKPGIDSIDIRKRISRLVEPYSNSINENIVHLNRGLQGCGFNLKIQGIRGHEYRLRVQ